MFAIGQTVRVIGVFAESFPDVYAITEIVNNEDGSVAYILGDAGGFDATYLEAV